MERKPQLVEQPSYLEELRPLEKEPYFREHFQDCLAIMES